MIDQRTNGFATAESAEALRDKIPADAEGPIFERGEKLTIRGYVFEVSLLVEKGIFLKPIGPVPTRQARRAIARANAR